MKGPDGVSGCPNDSGSDENVFDSQDEDDDDIMQVDKVANPF